MSKLIIYCSIAKVELLILDENEIQASSIRTLKKYSPYKERLT